MSLRAYARHRGCAISAVVKAVQDGRLSASVGRSEVGHPKILDAAKADAEWKASTYADMVPLTGPTAPKKRNGEAEDAPSLAEARARLDAAKAELAEMDLAERRGELLPASDVEARMVGVFASCKTKLLGVPTWVRQQDPGLTRDQVRLFESAIREALEGLAGEPDREERGG